MTGSRTRQGERTIRLPGRFGIAATALGLLAAAFVVPASGSAQLTSAAAGAAMPRIAPRVFLECEAPVPCNQGLLRGDVGWVEWLEVPEGADVLVTIRGASPTEGTSGQRFVLDFAGAGTMERLTDQLTYAVSTPEDASETTAGLARLIAMGLVRYGVEAGLGTDMALAVSPRLVAATAGSAADTGGASGTPAAVAYDPWNYWVFRVGLSGNVNIEENREIIQLNPSFGADRVTDNWKLNFNMNFNLNRDTRTIPATSTSPAREINNDRDNWGISTLVVKSISGHVSTGIDIGAGNSIQNNQQARITVAPGIEWNYYPYAEQNRRQLIAHYAVGAQYNNYADTTILGVARETVPLHKVGVQYRASEDWGNAGISLNAAQYLHQGGLYSFGASGNLQFRIIRGLDLNLNASGGKIADQIYLPASALSEEDVLLGRAALPTGYDFQFSVGLNYRWGSSFSTIVNSRMQSMGGGGGGGFGGGPPGGGGGGGGRGGGPPR
ncbi:MAG: hypothetical protein WEG36_12670 [Gemmatimonadota bacterium]